MALLHLMKKVLVISRLEVVTGGLENIGAHQQRDGRAIL